METLSSFWKKLTVGTKVKVTYTDTAEKLHGVSIGTITKSGSTVVRRDGDNFFEDEPFTAEKPCSFWKPKASEVQMSDNKLTEHDERASTTVVYEILGKIN